MSSQIQNPITLKRWILFTTCGWFIGILLVVGFALLSEIVFKMEDEFDGQAAIGIGMGAGVGLMQWLAIRKYLAASQKLFWFSLLGFTVAFIIRDIVAGIINEKFSDIPITVEVTIPIAVLLGAYISSLLQYKFVFNAKMDTTFRWIIYSMIGWLLATLITMSTSILDLKLGENFPKILIVIIALLLLSIGGPILGYITGWYIVPALKTYGVRKTNA